MSTKLSGTFTATGQSNSVPLLRHFNVSLGTFTGTINLERSFDNGTNWEVTDTFSTQTSAVAFEPEKGVLYRFNCITLTAGTPTYRLGGSGNS